MTVFESKVDSDTPKLLVGKPVAEKLFAETEKQIRHYGIDGYLAIIRIGENHPGATYIRKKQEYASSLGLGSKVFSEKETVFDDIEYCNNDPLCLGVIIQLPVLCTSKEYADHPGMQQNLTKKLLNTVNPLKDADCLGERLQKISLIGTKEISIAPATPSAIIYLLEYYGFMLHQSYQDKTIAVIGESDLIGKPLTTLLHPHCKTIRSFNEFSDQKEMRAFCQTTDILISATGKLHLIDEGFLNPSGKQIILDAGWGIMKGKQTGDVDCEKVLPYCTAITPVPGGIGPVTVASLFWNIVLLRHARNRTNI